MNSSVTDDPSDTPILRIIDMGHLTVVNLLLELGVDVDVVAVTGKDTLCSVLRDVERPSSLVRFNNPLYFYIGLELDQLS